MEQMLENGNVNVRYVKASGAEMRLVYCHLPYCFRDVSDLSGRFL
jgi:hypothetical protein